MIHLSEIELDMAVIVFTLDTILRERIESTTGMNIHTHLVFI